MRKESPLPDQEVKMEEIAVENNPRSNLVNPSSKDLTNSRQSYLQKPTVS